MAFEVVSWTTPLERGRYVPLHSCIDVSAASIGRDLYVRNREGEVSPWDMDNRSLMIVCNRRICGGDLISLPPMHGASSFHHHAIPLKRVRPGKILRCIFDQCQQCDNNLRRERPHRRATRLNIESSWSEWRFVSIFAYIDIFDDENDTLTCLKYQRIDETLTKEWLWLAIYFFFSNVGS